jgi:hypothetical protein
VALHILALFEGHSAVERASPVERHFHSRKLFSSTFMQYSTTGGRSTAWRAPDFCKFGARSCAGARCAWCARCASCAWCAPEPERAPLALQVPQKSVSSKCSKIGAPHCSALRSAGRLRAPVPELTGSAHHRVLILPCPMLRLGHAGEAVPKRYFWAEYVNHMFRNGSAKTGMCVWRCNPKAVMVLGHVLRHIRKVLSVLISRPSGCCAPKAWIPHGRSGFGSRAPAVPARVPARFPRDARARIAGTEVPRGSAVPARCSRAQGPSSRAFPRDSRALAVPAQFPRAIPAQLVFPRGSRAVPAQLVFPRAADKPGKPCVPVRSPGIFRRLGFFSFFYAFCPTEAGRGTTKERILLSGCGSEKTSESDWDRGDKLGFLA